MSGKCLLKMIGKKEEKLNYKRVLTAIYWRKRFAPSSCGSAFNKLPVVHAGDDNRLSLNQPLVEFKNNGRWLVVSFNKLCQKFMNETLRAHCRE